MKNPVVPAGRLLLALLAPLALATAQTPPAKKNSAAKAPPPATKAADKKEEAPAKIEGVEIARGEKGFLGLQVVGGNFKLSFYDAKKKPTAPDFTRAVLRWDPNYKVGKERAILAPGGGSNSLTSEKAIRPPYNFKVFITLTRDTGEGEPAAGESYVVDFRQ